MSTIRPHKRPVMGTVYGAMEALVSTIRPHKRPTMGTMVPISGNGYHLWCMQTGNGHHLWRIQSGLGCGTLPGGVASTKAYSAKSWA